MTTKSNETDKLSADAYRIGVDVGGSKMHGVLFDGHKVVENYTLATPTDNLNHFFIMCKAVLEPLFERADKDKRPVEFIGWGLAGTINHKTGRLLQSPNLPILNNTKFLSRVRTELNLNLPMRLDNDANCFTRAEALLGAGENSDNVFGLTIGTGIGGGWWQAGQIYHGAHGAAGEPGAMIVDLDHRMTLEAAYQKLTQNNPRLLAQEAYEGDILAGKSFEELGIYLGLALANIINLLDPSLIVVGGGAAASSDLFLKTAEKTMRKYLASPEAKKTALVKSKLGRDAGAIGAALLG